MYNKRIFLSLRRRKGNLLLFFILLCMLTLMIVICTIYKTASREITEIEKTYGSTFKVQVIMDTNNPDLWEERPLDSGGTFNAYIGPNVDMKMLERIAQVKGIKEFEAGRDCWIILYEYELTHGAFYSSYQFQLEHPEKEALFAAPADDFKNMIYIACANAVRNSAYNSQFYNGSLKMVEGRHITLDDVHKSIVSKTFANANHLKPGNHLKIDTPSIVMEFGYPVKSLGTVDTEIVGIFETTYHQAVSEYTSEYDILDNWVFVDSHSGMEFDKIFEVENKLGSGTFFVDNPVELDKIIADVKKIEEIDWSYYTVIKDDSVYRNAVAPLKTIRIIMMILIGITAAAAVCLLLLTVFHSIKKRTRELGILMSIGLNGKEIKQQLIWEHILIGIAAYVIALFIGMTSAPVLGNRLLGLMNQGNEEKFYSQEEIEAAAASGEAVNISELAKNQRTSIAPPESIDCQVDIVVAVIVLLSNMAVIYFCIHTAVKKTLKLEPIRILSMIE